ncbi:MAG TPA: hypothetical protein VEA59_07435 [Patescibacteria group bacterium]|nr:hypothetical protein [Patescibacteria group bacterium]
MRLKLTSLLALLLLLTTVTLAQTIEKVQSQSQFGKPAGWDIPVLADVGGEEPGADGKGNQGEIRKIQAVSRDPLESLNKTGHFNTYYIHDPAQDIRRALPSSGDNRIFDESSPYGSHFSPRTEHRVYMHTPISSPEAFRAVHVFAGGHFNSQAIFRLWGIYRWPNGYQDWRQLADFRVIDGHLVLVETALGVKVRVGDLLGKGGVDDTAPREERRWPLKNLYGDNTTGLTDLISIDLNDSVFSEVPLSIAFVMYQGVPNTKFDLVPHSFSVRSVEKLGDKENGSAGKAVRPLSGYLKTGYYYIHSIE